MPAEPNRVDPQFLQVKTLVGEGNISVRGDDLHAYISGGASNIGVGSGIYSGTISDEFQLRSISGIGGVNITGFEDNTIVVSGQTGSFYDKSNPSGFITGVDSGHLITGASNIGTGSGIYSGTLENDLKFKTLIAGPNIALSGDGEHLMISGAAAGGGGGVTWTTPPPTHKNYAGTQGQISFDNTYYYICIETNEWRRVAISEW
jgi:hypothetical protein